MEHEPQWVGSEDRSTQALPQADVPAGHRHVPSRHGIEGGQGLSQAPQWSGSEETETQALPQQSCPGPQAGSQRAAEASGKAGGASIADTT